MEADLVSRAVAAATALAQGEGLPVNDAVVIQNSNKLALRLVPCDVFARVAPWGSKSLHSRSSSLSAGRRGEPGGSAGPSGRAGGLRTDGFAVTFWTYYETLGPHRYSPDDYANALERLHAGMRSVEIVAPHFTERVAEAERLVTNRRETPALPDGGPSAPHQHAAECTRTDPGPRSRRTAAARRTTSGQSPRHPQRPALHRLRNLLPRAGRVRRRARAARGQREVSRCRPSAA